MTRFARAKGSKASNERVEEKATGWSIMKQQLLEKHQEKEDNQKRKEFEQKRHENYQSFLAEQKQDKSYKNASWAEFSDCEEDKSEKANKLTKNAKSKKVNGIGKLKKKKTEAKSVSGKEKKKDNISNEINKFCNDVPDEISKQYEEMKEILEKKLKNGNIEKNPNINPKKKQKEQIKDEIVKNEASPEEVKISHTTFDVKVSKPKKKKLKIKQNEQSKDEIVEDEETPEEVKISHTTLDVKISKPKKKKQQKLVIPPMSNSEGILESSKEKPAIDSKKQLSNKKRKLNQFCENNNWNNETQQDTNNMEVEVESTMSNDLQQPGKPKKIKKKKNKKKVETNDEPQKTSEKRKLEIDTPELNIKKLKTNPNVDKNISKQKFQQQKQRRKPEPPKQYITINGVQEEIVQYGGFPVKKSDADRLQKLRQDMVAKGIPHKEIIHTMKLERRKAEKALTRDKKLVCFQCRKSGHLLSDCPELGNSKDQLVDRVGTGICFKCGSTEHTSFVCKVVKGDQYNFAKCFICCETGHISKQCPDNPKGLYPRGGACRVCGDVTHLKKDCPQFQDKQEEHAVTLNTLGNVNSIEDDDGEVIVKPVKKKTKIVKF